MLKITLTRSPALHQYGPEETKVLQVPITSIHFNYNLFLVDLWLGDGEIEIGHYDDEIGGWRIQETGTTSVWSDVRIESTEE